ncbi:MAG: HAD family hydrolase [Ruminococcaceae bacterium]|nr:HAD family hydrolase [Oscillospiraceae bacterium]
MIRAVVFDFDGTIADTIPAIRAGLNMTMRELGYPEHSLAGVRSFINYGARNLVRSALPAEYREDEAHVDRVLDLYESFYGQTYLQTKEAYDGIPALIEELHSQHGVKIGVLSNKEHMFVVNLVDQVLLPNTFEAVQGNIPSKPAKPHPYLSNLVAESLGVAPEECVMVGDSDVDIRTAHNANMTHVGVSWGYRDENTLRENGANLIARDVCELRKILLDLIEQKG